MITQKSQEVRGLLVKVGLRPAGSMEKDGKTIQWEDVTQIVILPFESDRNLAKYTIAPDCANGIIQLLDDVHWGCFVELVFSGRQVVDVRVLEDILSPFYGNC